MMNYWITSAALATLLAFFLTGCATASSANMPANTSPTMNGPTKTLPSDSTPTLAVTISPTPEALAITTSTPKPSATPAPVASPTPTTAPLTTLLFTGVIVPARCVQASIDASGDPDYPYKQVHELITDADLAVGSLNATVSDLTEPAGCNWSYQMVGRAANAGALARAGFDVMSVASNHIKDCGQMKGWCDDVFLDTLNNLEQAGVDPVGGGENLPAALQPVVRTVNGVRFGFVSLGEIKMDEGVFARSDHPGIARLAPENLQAAIRAARQAADVVIVLPHWGPEDVAMPSGPQQAMAKQIIAAGADLVVGNHTHVVQGIQTIGETPVFYGLGNFVFDQWYPDHRQGVILLVKFQGTQYLGYELIPTHVDQDGQVFVAGEEEAAAILQGIEQVSESLR